jgi:hypothetical protein
MVLAQALVERGMLDAIVASIWSALQQVDYYVGQGNAKWALLALAVVLGYFFLKPRR